MLEICKRCSFNKGEKPCTFISEAECSGSCLVFDDDYDGFGPSMAGLADW